MTFMRREPFPDEVDHLPHPLSDGGTLTISPVQGSAFVRVVLDGSKHKLPSDIGDCLWTSYSDAMGAVLEWLEPLGVTVSIPLPIRTNPSVTYVDLFQGLKFD